VKAKLIVVGYAVYCPTTGRVLGRGGISGCRPFVHQTVKSARQIITRRRNALKKLKAENHYKMHAAQEPIVDLLTIKPVTVEVWT
jgi:hypothetical protein